MANPRGEGPRDDAFGGYVKSRTYGRGRTPPPGHRSGPRGPGGLKGSPKGAGGPRGTGGGPGGSTRGGQRPPRGGAPRARRLLLLTAAVMSLVVLAATGVLWGVSDYAMARVERVAAFEQLDDRPSGSQGVNILLVGSDRRAGLSPQMRKKLHVGKGSGRRSDTMILAHISTADNRASLISLPRDWYVTIPAHRSDDGERVPAQKNKLNAAYSLGGANLTVATVEQNTGMHIDHYVEASFLGFVEVVDAIGGVDVCVPEPVHDPASGLRLPAGKSHLNGVRSLQYVRARKAFGDGSDLGRIERQQKFLASMMQQALSTGTLLNPLEFSRFLNASLAAVTVDRELSSGDLRRLAMTVRDLDPARVSFLTVPIADAGVSTESAGVAAMADKQKAQRLFGRIRGDQPIGRARKAAEHDGQEGGGTANASGEQTPRVTIPPERILVEVYNDTGTAGLGAKATRDLRGVGFQIEQPPRDADPPNTATTTVVQYGPERRDSARTVAASLPGARTKMVSGLGDDIQVVIGSSYDGAREVQVSSGSSGSDSSGSGGGGSSGFDTRSASKGPCA